MTANLRDLTAELAAVAFVIAVFYLLFLPRRERLSRRAWPAWGVAGLFLLAILWSMWSEMLRPLLQAGETGRALRTALGLAILVLGMVTLVYGGFWVVSGMLKTMQDEAIVENIRVIQQRRPRFPPETVRAAQRANLTALLRAARPGCLWMLLASLLMALGGWLAR